MSDKRRRRVRRVERLGGGVRDRRDPLLNLTMRILLYVSNEAKATAVHGLDSMLGPTIVSYCFTCSHHAGTQSRFPDKLFSPQMLEKLFFRHHAVAMHNEIFKYLIHFGPERHANLMMTEFIAFRIKRIVAKDVAHRSPSLSLHQNCFQHVAVLMAQ
jgi:hypothetical protein